MKKLFLALLLSFFLINTAEAIQCYGVKPIRPYTYCPYNDWIAICVDGQWVWVCKSDNTYNR